MTTAAHIIERARSVRIEDEIAKRGITLRGGVDRCGPCPRCGGYDRFSIHLRKQIFYCRGCKVAGDIIALVQYLDNCTFIAAVETLIGDDIRPQAAPPAAKTKQSAAEYEREQRRKAAWLWSQRKPITGTVAEQFLRAVRKITCALPSTLGFLPPRGEHSPAMIACFGLCEEPEPSEIIPPHDVGAVHLTKLRPDGSGKAEIKPNKIIIGSPGALPIVLAPVNDLLGLCICEGIEDALTAHQATGLGAWAAGSAGRMPKLAAVIPSYVECITIYAHRDEAGQEGARQLAQALGQRGIEIIIEGLS